MVERLKEARRESVRVSLKQGTALHEFLNNSTTRKALEAKLPSGTHQRAVYEVRISFFLYLLLCCVQGEGAVAEASTPGGIGFVYENK